MKKILIKPISLVLVLLMSTLMMFSCAQIWQGKDMNPEACENKDEVEKAEAHRLCLNYLVKSSQPK